MDLFRTARFLAAGLAGLLAMLALAGCGKDKSTNPDAGGSTTYTGSVSGDSAATRGKLAITLATASPVPQNAGFRAEGVFTVTGSFAPAVGAPVALAGDYDDAAKRFAVTGGDWVFSGSLTGLGLEGFGTRNSVPTEFDWFTLLPGSGGVTVVIGTYTRTSVPIGETGSFCFAISGTEVHGNAVAQGSNTRKPLNGTYTALGGAISIENPAAPAGPKLATGTYNSTAGTASGDYDDGAGNSGTWAGTKQ
jgi:hypothetical protein